MKLCAVQLASDKGDLQANLLRHVHCVEQAVRHGAQVVVFPELSLSGYEPSLARELAQPLDTTLVDPLQVVSDRHGVVIAFGLPLATAAGVQIAMAVLRPGQPRLGYAKQRLHADELPFFVAGDQPLLIAVDDLRLAPAICYESMFFEHAQQVCQLGAELYLVSVAKTAKGIKEGYQHYPEVARRFAMPVVLANCIGPADTFVGAGGSAAWDAQGNLLATLDDVSPGLIVLDTLTGKAQAVPLAELGA